MCKNIKIVSILSLLCILVFTLSSCKKTDSTVATGAENVTLKWVFMGPGELKDSQKVWAKFNEKLQDYLPNTTIDFEAINASEYSEKWRLLVSSCEKVDIAWVGYTQNYTEEVNRGSFLPLNDLIDKYAPNLKETIPDWALQLQTINGQIYSIPCMQMLIEIPVGLGTPKNLYDKYLGDEKAKRIEGIFASDKKISKEDFALIEEYLEKLKTDGKIGKGVQPITIATIIDRVGYKRQAIDTFYNTFVERDDESLTLKDLSEKGTEGYDLIASWFEKGYIRDDILGVVDYVADIGVENGYVLFNCEDLKGADETASLKYKMDIKVIPFDGSHYIRARETTTNTAIASNCKNPERAIKFIELMNTEKGKDLLNLLSFGIEGEHYKKVSDNRIELLGKSTPGSSDNNYGYNDWCLGNALLSYETQHNPVGFKEYCKELNDTAIVSPVVGFRPDITNLSVESSQFTAISKEYLYLKYGGAGVTDYKKLLAEKQRKLKLAGSDKMFNEIQRQFEVWKEKYKK